MNRIQKWFEVMAGVTQEEQARQAIARAIFCQPGFDVAALKIPACWRRQVKVKRTGV